MNEHSRRFGPDVEEALRVLARAAAPEPSDARGDALARELRARLAALAGEAALSRGYPADFRPDAAYRASLPDIQNGCETSIRGARRAIQHVGIANFRLPLRFRTRDGEALRLETAVTGTVSLDAMRKGINMSRVLRSFYAHAEREFSLAVAAAALDDQKRDHETFDARILMRLSYPMQVASLRSGLSGWQYYDTAMELVDRGDERLRLLHLDYVYSSTCPCSLELAEHARRTRGQLATPHSQRSVARISVAMEERAPRLWIEDLVDLCRRAVPTETQVMVKREDEQAFAELNAANPIFVEDAARLFAAELEAEPRVGDFRVAVSHQESLHSHDAVSVLAEGETFAAPTLDPRLFDTLAR